MPTMRLPVAFALATVMFFAAQQAQAATSLIASDPFTNSESQHRTVVEPDTFAFGSTIVAAAQSGRYFDGGSSGVRYATSTNNGASWTQSTLPAITTHNANGGPFDRATDVAVAFDAKHNVWLVSTLALMPNATSPAVLTSRSLDGGLTFAAPVTTAPFVPGTSYDKNWIVCDNSATSPRYGNCYTTWDDNGHGNRLLASTSTDGGVTWGVPKATASGATGLGGQPLVQADGTVIVPSADANETQIIAIKSTDGGASWSNPVLVANVSEHTVAGGLRTGPLPSAEMDAAGKVYVVWQDCRFRPSCRSNDIVLSTSTNGTSWTAPARVPTDGTASSVDHFIPGLGVDRATSGATAKLGLTYYAYANRACGSTCSLQVRYIQSNDGGASWGGAVQVAPAFAISRIPDTSQGRMVGDYISTSWLGGKAFGPVPVARVAMAPFAFSLGLEVPPGGITAGAGLFSSANDRPVATAAPGIGAQPQSPPTRR